MADMDALTTLIGTRVRKARKERGWTLEDLARESSLSRRMVVSVEQATVNPSVGTLLRLSEALGVGLPELVDARETAHARVTRSGTAPTLWRGPAGGVGALVASTSPPQVVELWEWTLEPGETYESEPHPDGTREVLQVLAGELEMQLAGDAHTLRRGDGVGYSGDVPHSYANTGGTAARFVFAVYAPLGVPRHRHDHGHAQRS